MAIRLRQVSFFAAGMQDYNRAIIVGSNSLGKASMQSIVPLDGSQQDFVKLTLEKFYRVTGDSNQIKGVVPDIALPILYDSIVQRETSYKTALKYDKINTKARFNSFRRDYYPTLIAQSDARLKNNPRFKEIIVANQEINELYNSPKKPLRVAFKDVFNDVHAIDILWKKVKKITASETNCVISNNSYDLGKLQFDAFQQENNTFKINDLKTNPYLEEAVAILNDFNNLKK